MGLASWGAEQLGRAYNKKTDTKALKIPAGLTRDDLAEALMGMIGNEFVSEDIVKAEIQKFAGSKEKTARGLPYRDPSFQISSELTLEDLKGVIHVLVNKNIIPLDIADKELIDIRRLRALIRMEVQAAEMETLRKYYEDQEKRKST